MTRCCGLGAPSPRAQALNASGCSQRRSLAASSGAGLRRPSTQAVFTPAISDGVTSGNLLAGMSGGHRAQDILCRAVVVADRLAEALPSTGGSIGTVRGAPGRPILPKLDNIDIAALGADVAALAAALATSTAHPGAQVMLYDTTPEPPTACDGGVLLSVNGLRALKALDCNLYRRIVTEHSSPVHEALWFDLQGELVRRMSATLNGRGGVTSRSSDGGSWRWIAPSRIQPKPAGSSSITADPDPSAPPLVMSFHDLREALLNTLPEDFHICGRHHMSRVEPCSSGSGSSSGDDSGGGGMMLRFAHLPDGDPVRAVRTKLLMGADGPNSAVRRLQFDNPPDPQHPSGYIVWRGRFTLRPRDLNLARNFTTAIRTWVDMRAARGADRIASLSPWQWFSGATKLVEDAVYSLPVEDASSTAINLALADAAILAAYTAQHGLTARALQEYVRLRGPRVSALLAVPPSGAERVRLREAPFLPQAPKATSTPPATAAVPMAAGTAADATHIPSLSSTMTAAVDSAAAAAAAISSPTLPLKEVLTKVAETAVAAVVAPIPPAGMQQVLQATRPSGGASRALLPSGAPAVLPEPMPSGASSPLFSRPSGARRMGPVPAAIAAVIGILAAGSRRLTASSPAAAASAVAVAPAPDASLRTDVAFKERAAAAHAVMTAAATRSADCGAGPSSSAAVATTEFPSYGYSLTPRRVWESLLQNHGSVTACRSGKGSVGGGEAPAPALQRDEHEGCLPSVLLISGDKARDTIVEPPYNMTEPPALVWRTLLGARDVPSQSSSSLAAATASSAPAPSAVGAVTATVSGSGSASGSSANSSSSGGSVSLHDNPCTLLPRPVLKQKPVTAPVAAAAVSADESASASLLDKPTSSVDDASPSSSLNPPASLRQPVTLTGPVGAASVGSGLESQRRRQRSRNQTDPMGSRWAGGDRHGGGKVTSGYGKAKRSSAASAAYASGSGPPFIAASKAKSKTAAARMTASRSTAAAISGVVGTTSTGHHMPVVEVAALHAHGAVAQFWEELNHLTLSSASLSSIDLP